MERKRVVHYAKSRTARVLTPTPTNHPESSSSLPTEGGSSRAPLASVESDVLVITKPRDGTNTAPSLRIQMRSPRTSGVSGSSVNTTATSRQSALPGQNRSATRQYNDYRPVHSLSSPPTVTPRKEAPELEDKQRQQRTHPQHRVPQDSAHTEGYNVRVSDANKSSAASCTCDTLNLLSYEVCQQEDCPVHYRGPYRGQRAPTTPGGTTSINRNNGGYTKQTVISNMAPSFTPKSRKVFPESSVRNPSDSNVRLSEQRVSVSKPSLSTAPSSKQEYIPRPTINTTSSPRNTHGGDTRGVSRTSHEFRDPTSNISLKGNTSNSHYQTVLQNPASNVRNGQAGAPESCLAQGVTLQPRRDLPHDKSRVPVLSRTVTPAQPGNTPQTNKQSYNKHVDKTTGEANHKPSATIEKAHTLPRYENRSTNHVSGTNQNVPHPKTKSHNTSQPQDRSHISVSRSQLQPYDRPADKTEPRLDSSTGLEDSSKLVPDFKPSWKRSSMRMATQGYTSMSDLTTSIESLTLAVPERNKSSRIDSQARSNGVQMNANQVSDNRLRNDNYKPDCARIQGRKEEGIDVKSNNQTNKKADVTISCDKHKSETISDKNSVKRKQFKLAPSSISGVWLLEDDMNRLMADMNQDSELNTNSGANCRNQRQLETEFSASKNGAANKTKETLIDGANKSKEIIIDRANRSKETVIDGADLDDHLNRLKRRSFMLATTSVSDLTCDVDEIELGRYSIDVTEKNSRSPQPTTPEMGKPNSSDNRTPEYQTGRPRGSSFSSGRLNSSFGSYYSCQSVDFGKSRPSPNTTPEDIRRRLNSSKEPNRSRGAANDTFDSLEYDSNASGDTSLYYTASSASFVTGDEVASRGSPSSDSKQRSPKIPTFQWWRKSPYPRVDEIPKSTGPPVSVQNKSSSLPNRGKAPKHSSPISNVLHCYGRGLNQGVNQELAQRYGQRGRGNSNSSQNQEKQDMIRSREQDDRQRSSSNPPPRIRGRYSDTLPRSQPIQRQISADLESLPRDESFTSGVPTSPSSGSLESLVPDWQERPRSPPSLGRPRRKLYAGFDSQPLPMDSFMSDSSSVYSEAMSDSSWTTSKSAEVESIHRAPYESENLASNARAVSSSASGARTPTRRMSGDNVLDLFSYTDKRHSLGENNHNLYRSTDNSCVNTCFKDSFYDKTFSNESLISFQSDVTTTGPDPYDNNDNQQEGLKTHGDSVVLDTNKFNNNAVLENTKRTNETSQLDRLNNGRVFDYGSRLSNNSGYFTSTESLDYHGQPRPLKASFSASAPRPQFPARRKYFSSKDILELLMTPEKSAVGGATSITSLEKQAQKVCKVILCCNEMDRPQVSSKEYHF